MRAVLTYHSIDDSGSPISIPAAVFDSHVRWLKSGAVRVVSLPELLASDASDPTDAVAITFDDGFRSFGTVFPALADHGLPVTLFVVTGHIGETNTWGGRPEPGIPTLPLLSWTELERLVESGVAIGAHTRTHARLTSLSPARAEEEMWESVQELRARLGVTVSQFSYPYGALNDDIANRAAKMFDFAVTTRFAPLLPGDCAMAIPRLDMYYFQRPARLDGWGTTRFKRYLWSVRTRRRLRERLT